jgi:hypothetical protein
MTGYIRRVGMVRRVAPESCSAAGIIERYASALHKKAGMVKGQR